MEYKSCNRASVVKGINSLIASNSQESSLKSPRQLHYARESESAICVCDADAAASARLSLMIHVSNEQESSERDKL